MKTKIFLIVIIAAFMCGCAQQVQNIDTVNDDKAKAVMGLDYRDFDQAASLMVQSMLSSNKLTKPGGGRYVVTTARIINDTMQRIDTDQCFLPGSDNKGCDNKGVENLEPFEKGL